MPHTARHTDYLAEEIGTATLDEQGRAFEAGSFQSFTLRFTAGRFGIDDTGSLRVVFRFASDMPPVQTADPTAAHYISAEASNGAVLLVDYNGQLNLRPWGKTITVKVARGFLSPGDSIIIRIGDRRGGSPGIRLQTFCEDRFEFRVLADVFATCNWALLPDQPWITIIPGPPARFRAVAPTLWRANRPFALGLRADDAWGNPTPRLSGRFRLVASHPVAGLPETFSWPEGARSHRIAGLSVATPADVTIAWQDEAGRTLAIANPVRIVAEAPLLPFWADMHGQSEETIGTNSIRRLAEYARDCAFLDAMCHQGNDFQITAETWADFNRAFAEWNEDGRFVFLPGYEWSGNTALGGDRNVIFLHEGETLHRSSHALVEDLSDADTDAPDARDLHRRLEGRQALCVPHVGGRYANLRYAHSRQLERSVEVHSDWGTFDWLLEDAFAIGARVGIVANSDGHKGRQGASHPGASLFGAYGGLTCYLAEGLTRDAIWDAMLWRRHYATTGALRAHCETRLDLSAPADLHRDDPALGGAPAGRSTSAGMGAILAGVGDTRATFSFDLLAGTPIERVDILNRGVLVERWRPYAAADLGRRIRILVEGSEYRGRGRETRWSGSLTLSGNGWRNATPINRFNLDRRFDIRPDGLDFEAVTTGGFAGVEALLDDAASGTLAIRTNLVTADIALRDIGYEDVVWEAGGLGRRIRAFRLPDANPHRSATQSRRVALAPGADNAFYIRATFEDGNVLWSSPIYAITA